MSYRTALATREELAAVGQLIDDYVRQNLDMAQWLVARDLSNRLRQRLFSANGGL